MFESRAESRFQCAPSKKENRKWEGPKKKDFRSEGKNFSRNFDLGVIEKLEAKGIRHLKTKSRQRDDFISSAAELGSHVRHHKRPDKVAQVRFEESRTSCDRAIKIPSGRGRAISAKI